MHSTMCVNQNGKLVFLRRYVDSNTLGIQRYASLRDSHSYKSVRQLYANRELLGYSI